LAEIREVLLHAVGRAGASYGALALVIRRPE